MLPTTSDWERLKALLVAGVACRFIDGPEYVTSLYDLVRIIELCYYAMAYRYWSPAYAANGGWLVTSYCQTGPLSLVRKGKPTLPSKVPSRISALVVELGAGHEKLLAKTVVVGGWSVT